VKVLAIAVLAACAPPQTASDTLNDTIRGYNEAMRWERFETAAQALPPKERIKTIDEWDERAKDLKFTEYDVVKVEPRGEREARAQVKISWYLSSEGTVHQTHEIQTWEKHGKNWELVDDRRLRGHEMPGLAEPLAHDDDDSDTKNTQANATKN